MKYLIKLLIVINALTLISCSNDIDVDYNEQEGSPLNLDEYNNLLKGLGKDTQYVDEVNQYSKVQSTGEEVFFIGSSTIYNWYGLSEDFYPMQVLNRGLGGSTLSQIIIHGESLFWKYSPNKVVLYIGDNDVFYYDADIFKTYMKLFINNFHYRLPDSKLYLISIKPSPARISRYSEYMEMNEFERNIADEKTVFFVDIWEDIILNTSKYFEGDGLHLNGYGYRIIVEKLKPLLLE